MVSASEMAFAVLALVVIANRPRQLFTIFPSVAASARESVLLAQTLLMLLLGNKGGILVTRPVSS